MDGPPRKRNWIPQIERSFEWSRIEAELLVLVYPGLFRCRHYVTTSLRVKLFVRRQLAQNKEVAHVGTGCRAD